MVAAVMPSRLERGAPRAQPAQPSALQLARLQPVPEARLPVPVPRRPVPVPVQVQQVQVQQVQVQQVRARLPVLRVQAPLDWSFARKPVHSAQRRCTTNSQHETEHPIASATPSSTPRLSSENP
ncbi:MAG TPA: hypothetical protein VFK05_38990 [Polyangiaceae bacterium]|nr:hypothetical protein [Polyangiaceae bacterium]